MANNTETCVVGDGEADYISWETFTLTHVDYPKGDLFAEVGFFVHLAVAGFSEKLIEIFYSPTFCNFVLRHH